MIRLAGPAGECLELAFDIRRVLPRKPGPYGAPLSEGAMAYNTGRNTACCEITLPGYRLSPAKQSVVFSQGARSWAAFNGGGTYAAKERAMKFIGLLIEHGRDRAHFLMRARAGPVGIERLLEVLLSPSTQSRSSKTDVSGPKSMSPPGLMSMTGQTLGYSLFRIQVGREILRADFDIANHD